MDVKLFTSSSVPINVEIDGKRFVAEKLTIQDYHMLGNVILDRRRTDLRAKYEEEREAGADGFDPVKAEMDCTNARNALVAPTPYELLPLLLDSYDGFSLVLYTCLMKKHPEVTFDWVNSLTLNETLIQLVYDLMDIKRKLVETKDKKEKSAEASDPPQPNQTGSGT